VSARVGPTQRVVLLCLMDGYGRTADRIDTDMLLSPGRAAGALRGLEQRGLAQRALELHSGMVWTLTEDGSALAAELYPDAEAEQPRCAHGRPQDEPCQECRTGPWRCGTCGDTVRGGQRAPHSREVHGDWTRQTTYTWAGDTQ